MTWNKLFFKCNPQFIFTLILFLISFAVKAESNGIDPNSQEVTTPKYWLVKPIGSTNSFLVDVKNFYFKIKKNNKLIEKIVTDPSQLNLKVKVEWHALTPNTIMPLSQITSISVMKKRANTDSGWFKRSTTILKDGKSIEDTASSIDTGFIYNDFGNSDNFYLTEIEGSSIEIKEGEPIRKRDIKLTLLQEFTRENYSTKIEFLTEDQALEIQNKLAENTRIKALNDEKNAQRNKESSEKYAKQREQEVREQKIASDRKAEEQMLTLKKDPKGTEDSCENSWRFAAVVADEMDVSCQFMKINTTIGELKRAGWMITNVSTQKIDTGGSLNGRDLYEYHHIVTVKKAR